MPSRNERLCRRSCAAVACTMALAAIAPALAATTDPDPDFSLEDTVQVGPFHMAPFFIVKDFGYDDNTRLDAADQRADFMVSFGPGARAVLPMGRLAAFSIWDALDYTVFARQSDLNHVSNSIRAKLHFYLRDVTVYADGEQRSTRDRPNSEIDFRIRNIATLGKLGFTWRPSGRGKVDMYLRQADFHYDAGKPDVPEGADPNQAAAVGESIATNLERGETTLGLVGAIRVRPRTSALIDVRAGRIDFELIDPQRDSSTRSIMGGLEFDPAGSLRGFLKLGVKHLAPDNPDLDGFSGVVADASLSARLFGRGEARALYQRDTWFSITGDNLFFIDDKRALSYEHFLNSRLSVEVGRQLEELDYPIPIVVQANTPARHRVDDIVWDRLSVRYRLGPSLKIGLSVGRWNRDSTFDHEDARRNTITTLLEYNP